MKTKDLVIGGEYEYAEQPTKGPTPYSYRAKVRVLATRVERKVWNEGYRASTAYDGVQVEVLPPGADPAFAGYGWQQMTAGVRVVRPAQIVKPWPGDEHFIALHREQVERDQAIEVKRATIEARTTAVIAAIEQATGDRAWVGQADVIRMDLATAERLVRLIEAGQ